MKQNTKVQEAVVLTMNDDRFIRIKEKKEKFTGKLEKRAFKIYKDKFHSDKEF